MEELQYQFKSPHGCYCTVVSRKYSLPFATLASVQNAGGLYAGCDDFSRDYAPLSVRVKHDLIVGGG